MTFFYLPSWDPGHILSAIEFSQGLFPRTHLEDPFGDALQATEPTHTSTWVILHGLPVCVPNHQRKPVLVKNDSWNVSLTTFYIRRWTCRF